MPELVDPRWRNVRAKIFRKNLFAVALCADYFARTNPPVCRVVIKRHIRPVQKGKLIVLMTPQTLDQSLGMAILVGGGQQLLQPGGKPASPLGGSLVGHLGSSAPQLNGIGCQAPQ